MSMDDTLTKLAKKSKYNRNAYSFVLVVMNSVMDIKKIKKVEHHQYIPPKQVLKALKAYGWLIFGDLAPHVFNHWGLKTNKSWGKFIINLVDNGLFALGEFESISDYNEGIDMTYDWNEFIYIETEEDVYNYIIS